MIHRKFLVLELNVIKPPNAAFPHNYIFVRLYCHAPSAIFCCLFVKLCFVYMARCCQPGAAMVGSVGRDHGLPCVSHCKGLSTGHG